MDIALDEVVHFDAIVSNPTTGAAIDADSTPTWSIYEEDTDTAILSAQNFTKRTSLTGDYRGAATLSTANGFEAGKWYNVVGTAIVGGITGKAVVMRFRVVLAEAVVGAPKVDTGYFSGQTITAAAGVTIPSSIASSTNVSDLQTHGDSTWATATGFATSGALASLVTTVGVAGAGLTALGDTRLANLDATVSSRLAASGYTAPANSTIASIDTRLPADPADASDITAQFAAVTASMALEASLQSLVTTVGVAGLGLSAIPKTGYKLATDGTDLISIDGKTLIQALQVIAAILGGKIAGAGTGTETFKGLDGTTDRAVVTVDSDGNRTGVTYP